MVWTMLSQTLSQESKPMLFYPVNLLKWTLRQWLPPNPQIQPSAHSSPHKHPLSSWKLSHLLTVLTPSTVTLLLALKDPSYHNLGIPLYSTLYTDSHSGIRVTQKLITSCFVWPGINTDVRRWTRSCIQCQRAKIHRHSTTPLSSFSTPDTRLSVVHVDIVGPLPPSHGYTYLLTCVDRYTRWPEAIPITSITAESVAQAFITGWISCFGVPATIITDRGRQFESQLWTNFTSLLGIKRSRTTAYHPQTNGMVECFHRQLKAAFKAQPNPNAWMESLPLIVSALPSRRISTPPLQR